MKALMVRTKKNKYRMSIAHILKPGTDRALCSKRVVLGDDWTEADEAPLVCDNCAKRTLMHVKSK